MSHRVGKSVHYVDIAIPWCGNAYINTRRATMNSSMQPTATLSQRHTFGLDSGSLSARAP